MGFYIVGFLRDANYCFTIFDLGQYGSNNDIGILSNLKFSERVDNNLLSIPDESEKHK